MTRSCPSSPSTGMRGRESAWPPHGTCRRISANGSKKLTIRASPRRKVRKRLRASSQLRDTFDIDIPLRRLFDAPTVAGLAEMVAGRQREREEQETHRLLARLETLDEREVEEELNKRAMQADPLNGQHLNSKTASP